VIPAGLLGKGAIPGARESHGRVTKGMIMILDLNLWESPVYGWGDTTESAVADAQARKGEPYPMCCERKYGMHARTCPEYGTKGGAK
jgi:hypothetical protein